MMKQKKATTKIALIIAVIAILNTSNSALAGIVTTSTGLDNIVEIILNDTQLQEKVPMNEIYEAAVAADVMNQIIIEAIINTGVANDKTISTADTREINDYIFQNHYEQWVILHGDDEDGEETGFHLVQNDGARTKLFGRNAINRVADSIYHLGFETHRRNHLLNEDGNRNASFQKVGIWLNRLLEQDLKWDILLENPNIKEVTGTTGTGLDQMIDVIYNDPGLQKRISTGDIRKGSAAANAMNHIIIKAIIATGIGNDGEITTNDARELNNYIVANFSEEWAKLHGDDEDDEETGFHLVQNDGAKTKLFDRNAINRVADGIYHLGFKTNLKNNLLNEDGNKNVSFKKVALWLQNLLTQDLKSEIIKNPDLKEISGTTETGLDQIIDIIYNDVGLQKRISTTDLREGSAAVDAMNHIIIEGIQITGIANDGEITTNDARELNNYIVVNYRKEWAILHGDDEEGEETGFHLLQNDGAKARLFGKNAINRVADGIYHLGFETNLKNRLLNEDGNKNVSFQKVALWLDGLLAEDLKGKYLENPAIKKVTGSTGTGLDQIISIIYTDIGLQKRISTSELREGSAAADAMNQIIIEAIDVTGIANDGNISADDVRELNDYIVANYRETWATLHGDDEDGEETGFHLLQNDGAKARLFGRNAINSVADGIYHLGFETNLKNRLLNEDGNKNASFKKVASWLSLLLQ